MMVSNKYDLFLDKSLICDLFIYYISIIFPYYTATAAQLNKYIYIYI